MQINFNLSKLKLSDRYKQRIVSKFSSSLDRLLKSWSEDLKIASLSIEKFTRSGYEIKFDMNLPGAPVNIKETHKILMNGIVKVKNQAKRQIKKDLDKLRAR